MFLGYQRGKITFTAQTREELENLPCVDLDKIEESPEDYILVDGDYLSRSEAEFLKSEEKKASVRSLRDAYLAETDKKMLSDYPISEEARAAYAAYRTYLRNLPENENFPNVRVLTFEDWQQKA